MTPETAETPLGLRQLAGADGVRVRQLAARAAGGGCQYVVVGGDGAELLRAREDSALLQRVLAGRSRPLHIDVYDTQDREVMKLRRPYSVGGDTLEVAVGGAPAAVVRRELTFLKPVLTVNDLHDRLVVRVKGPASTSGECEFELYSAEKKRIGVIAKRWGGGGGAGADGFALRFPRELDVRYKAALIATCFLIDFLIFDT